MDSPLYNEFIQFVGERQNDFYRLAFRYTHDQQAALDVVQEALEKALRGLAEALEALPAGLPPDIAQTLDLHAAIDALEPKLKTVVMLRFFEDMKFAEISEVTGVNINTVKSRLSAALRRLRLSLEEESL